ncbi:phosphotransferase family protein [Microbacterium sp. NPDC077663]|uniref:phosphotransferase family protein n=1 Tax=Microbacterium sp. NPDC077663 TaxID=3364189 RepID=UPI0037C6C870
MIAADTLHDPVLALDVLLDAARLSEALGREVEITRVRWKPATSLVLGVRTGEDHGWVAAYADPGKLLKLYARAASIGAQVTRLRAVDAACAGPLAADRALAKPLGRARRVLGDGATVLRYNPHRRVVLRTGGDVVKVATTDAGRADLTQRLAAGGAAVLPAELVRPGIQRTRWWGAGDLAASPSRAAAAAAGRALAALHDAPADDAPDASPAEGDLATAVAAIGRLDADAGARAAALAERVRALPTGERSALVHGDFTADQVLRRGDEVRLIDFDRAGRGEPERDLGAFTAGELLAGRALTDALRSGYDAPVNERAVDRWTATAALQRAVEPFRTGRADWRDGLHAAIDVGTGAAR